MILILYFAKFFPANLKTAVQCISFKIPFRTCGFCYPPELPEDPKQLADMVEETIRAVNTYQDLLLTERSNSGALLVTSFRAKNAFVQLDQLLNLAQEKLPNDLYRPLLKNSIIPLDNLAQMTNVRGSIDVFTIKALCRSMDHQIKLTSLGDESYGIVLYLRTLGTLAEVSGQRIRNVPCDQEGVYVKVLEKVLPKYAQQLQTTFNFSPDKPSGVDHAGKTPTSDLK